MAYLITVESEIPAHVTPDGLFMERSLNQRILTLDYPTYFVATGMALVQVRLDFAAAGLPDARSRVISAVPCQDSGACGK